MTARPTLLLSMPPLPEPVRVVVLRGRTWWDDRQPRERLLLMGLAAILSIWILIAGILGPIADARQTVREDIRRYDSLAVRLRAAGPELRAAGGISRTGSVQSIVATTAAEASLQIRQIEPKGAATSVALDGADFNRLVQWLDRLNREAGLSVSEIELERQTAPGVVNARLSLVRP